MTDPGSLDCCDSCQKHYFDTLNLRRNLDRKYAHCRTLKKEIESLKALLETACEELEFWRATNTLYTIPEDSGDDFLPISRKPSLENVRESTFDGIYQELSEEDDDMPLFYSESESGEHEEGEDGQVHIKAANEANQEITAFTDQDAGWNNQISSGSDPTMTQVTTIDSDIANFMKRPVRIAEFVTSTGSSLQASFYPWSEYLNTQSVRRKVDNYNLIRGKLHLKFLITGTGFDYGRYLVSYNPLDTFDATQTTTGLNTNHVRSSQRPHIFLNPTNNQGGEMVLPFFYHHDYLPIRSSGGAYQDMGRIYIHSMEILKNAQSALSDVHITVFAWMEDVVLTMPTRSLVSEMGMDEYGQGIISKPASTLAKAAGLLEHVPVIGVYAKATEMVSNTVAGVASMFGYSRPSVLNDIQPYKNMNAGNLANTDAPELYSKLTLDSKQEITIDPRTVGLDGTDEMSIIGLVTRESWIDQFSWQEAQLLDEVLWSCRVTPCLAREYTDTNGTAKYMTPAALMATQFRFWRGTIKYRFQVVCSAFHKGRLLVTFDPRGGSATTEYNTVYSRVIDIATEKDFEIEVGWANNKHWLSTNIPTQHWDTVVQAEDTSDQFNGVIQVQSASALISPNAEEGITINVFTSMCPDAKFGSPWGRHGQFLSYFPNINFAALTAPEGEEFTTRNTGEEQIEALFAVRNEGRNRALINGEVVERPPDYVPPEVQRTVKILQSESGIGDTPMLEDRPTDSTSLTNIARTHDETDECYNVFFGEAPVSLRDMCKRYIMQRVKLKTSGVHMVAWRTKNLPYYHGLDPQGLDAGATNPKTMGQNGPLNFWLPCFAGWRGSLRRKYFFFGLESGGGNVHVSNYGPYPLADITYQQNGSTDDTLNQGYMDNMGLFSFTGAAQTMTSDNRTTEVEFPFYSDRRFHNARVLQADDLDCDSHDAEFCSDDNNITRQNNLVIDYVAAGDDFSMHFFTGVPPMWEYVTTEAT